MENKIRANKNSQIVFLKLFFFFALIIAGSHAVEIIHRNNTETMFTPYPGSPQWWHLATGRYNIKTKVQSRYRTVPSFVLSFYRHIRFLFTLTPSLILGKHCSVPQFYNFIISRTCSNGILWYVTFWDCFFSFSQMLFRSCTYW